MKIAIVTDTHFGYRNDNPIFGNYIRQFFKKCFFPTLEKLGIKTIVHCGDVVDRRKMIQFVTARNLYNSFILPCQEGDYDVYCLVGNHDVYFKNTNDVNALNELYNTSLKNFKIIKDVCTLEIGNTEIDFFPWINCENEQEAFDLMKNGSARIAFGHFEMIGYEMTKGRPMQTGMSDELVSRYDFVGSGHLHEKSSKGNVHFFGCPYELSWSDYGSPRGFHVLDLETLEFDFYPNPVSIFQKLEYDDRIPEEELFSQVSSKNVKNKVIKIYVNHSTNQVLLNRFCSAVEALSPVSVVTIQAPSFIKHEEMSEIDSDDTLSMLVKFSEMSFTDKEQESKESLITLLKDIYSEAVELEEL